jgi:hypothetical protein
VLSQAEDINAVITAARQTQALGQFAERIERGDPATI